MKKLLVSLIAVCGLFPVILSAQDRNVEKRKLGLTFPNIGIILRISDDIAFLPDINLSHNWSNLGTYPGDSTSNSVGVNAALRFYLKDWKGMRFYVSPKYGYNWNSVKSPLQGSSIASELRSHSVSGAWGVEYAVSDRISLFGDIGIRCNRGKTEHSAEFGSDITSNSIGTAGTWGLILHLR